MSNSISFILGLMLFLAGISLVLNKEKNSNKSELKIKDISIPEINALILLVSKRDLKKNIKTVITYKVLEKISRMRENKKTYIWLISDEIYTEGSSYQVAQDLKKHFSLEYLKIKIEPLENIYDPNKVFSQINQVFNFAEKELKMPDSEIICDFTGGNKQMSIGMTLACLGRGRLVYFTEKDTYTEIDTRYLLKSVLSLQL